MADLCSDAAFIVQAEQIVFANSASAQPFGAASISDLLGRPVFGFVEPEHRQNLKAACHRTHGIAVATTVEGQRWRSLDGRALDVDVVLARVPWGGNFALQFIVRDVSERKRSAMTLQSSVDGLRLAQRYGKTGVWYWDPVTGEVILEPEFEELYDVPPGTIRTYQEWARRVDSTDLPRLERERDQAVRDGHPFEAEFRIYLPDGSVRWLLSRGRGEYDESGRLVRVVGVNIDITEQKQVQAALRESEDRLLRTQHAARLGAWEWDLKSNHVSWSAGIYELLGLPPDSFEPGLGRWLEFVLPEDRVAAQSAVQSAIAAKGPFNVQFRVLRRDGAARWFSSVGRIEVDAAGDPCRMLGVNIDITEHREVEQRLRESHARERAFLEHLPVGV